MESIFKHELKAYEFSVSLVGPSHALRVGTVAALFNIASNKLKRYPSAGLLNVFNTWLERIDNKWERKRKKK